MNLQETINLRRKMELLRRDIKTSDSLDKNQIHTIDEAYKVIDTFINRRQQSAHNRGQWFKVDITGCITISGKLTDVGIEHAGKNVCLQSNGKIYISGIGEQELREVEN